QNLSMADRLKSLPVSAYVLGPEDGLEISVFRHEGLTMNVRVSSTGMISYYLIGDVKAAGLTAFQLREEVQKRLARYIKNPQVFVRITEFRSHKVFVLGQVKNPGVYRMRGDFSLVEALSAAGGIGPYGYLSGAYVVRAGKILLVNFVELIEKGNMQENIPLLPGDVVYIPSTQDRKVYVLGEVNNQSAIPARDGLTLLSAVAEAGGFTRDARKDSIVVMRGNLSKPEIMKINVEAMDVKANIALERGDIVYVASTTIANVERMALRLYNILQPFYSVSRTLVWGDAAVGVMEGKDSRLVIPTD
ncbi:MAG: SLBB domain-containing protein, partial [Deltaproteobacteria bacterium]|nr:SLBB domain-containing protein [Deltaproteobacteria bacterium]